MDREGIELGSLAERRQQLAEGGRATSVGASHDRLGERVLGLPLDSRGRADLRGFPEHEPAQRPDAAAMVSGPTGRTMRACSRSDASQISLITPSATKID